MVIYILVIITSYLVDVCFTDQDSSINDTILCTGGAKFGLVNQQDLVDINQTSLVFYLKTCNDTRTRLVLSPYKSLSYPFQKLFLFNTAYKRTRIYACLSNKMCSNQNTPTYTDDIVNPTEFRSLWLSWNSDAVVMGTGSIIGQNTLMSNNYVSTSNLRYFGIKSETCESQWIFKKGDRLFDLLTEDLSCESSSTVDNTELTTQPTSSAFLPAHTSDIGNNFSSGSTYRTAPETTIQYSTSIVTTSDSCYCGETITGNLTSAELTEYIENIKRYLKVDPKGTSLFRSKLISASDSRMSASVIGWSGVAFVSVPVITIVCIDILNFTRNVN